MVALPQCSEESCDRLPLAEVLAIPAGKGRRQNEVIVIALAPVLVGVVRRPWVDLTRKFRSSFLRTGASSRPQLGLSPTSSVFRNFARELVTLDPSELLPTKKSMDHSSG